MQADARIASHFKLRCNRGELRLLALLPLCCPSFSLAAMAGSLPWDPHLMGDPLPPFPSLAESINRDSVPTRREHSGWTQAAFLKWFPSGAFDEALWDTVLALWRLHYDVDKDADNDLWDRYVVAYLVSTPSVYNTALSYYCSTPFQRRHHLLCKGRPLPSIRDFAAELGQRPGFPIDNIPSILRGNQTKNNPSSPADHTQPSRPPSRHRAAISQVEDQPVVESILAIQSTDGEEQETIDQLMDDVSTGLEDDPAARPKPKRRKVEADIQSKSPAATSRVHHNPGRLLKKSTAVKPPRAGDLRNITVNEDSEVDTKMLPKWEDKVRKILCFSRRVTVSHPPSALQAMRDLENEVKVMHPAVALP